MKYEEIVDDIFDERPKRVILDTDTYNEMDDQYAIAYALASDRIKLEAITAAPFHTHRSNSFGDGMERSYQEILRIMDICGAKNKYDVLRGSTLRFSGKGIDSPAARRIIDAAHDKSEPLYILAIGCLTNIASALEIDPSIKDNIVLIWLGGQCFEHCKLDEFNLIQDYTAAQFVVGSGVKMIMLPAVGDPGNGTQVLVTTKAGLRGISGDSPAAQFFREDFPREYTRGEFDDDDWDRTIWDIAAPGLLSVPEAYSVRMVTAPIFAEDRMYSFKDNRPFILYMDRLDANEVFADAFAAISKL